jgi:preprotein translocase subunit SecF
VPLGVDFKGGTQVQVQFDQTPDIEPIRQAMAAAGIKDASIQTIKAVDQPAGTRC